jgi:hypothetical protein
VQLRPAAGLQLKLLAPAAVSDVLLPMQMLSLPVTVTTGMLLTATVTLDVSAQPAAFMPVTV